MKKIIYLLAIGTFALFLTGCYTLDDDNFEPQTITPVLIAKGENCFAESLASTNMVIKTNEAWNALLDNMSSVTDSFAETEIDFSHYVVLAVFEEVKGNGVWSIDITGVTEHANKIVVAYTNLETGNATEVITQPYHIVRIPKSGKEVVFEKTDNGGGEEPDYPIEISFTEYSLEGTSCQWTDFDNSGGHSYEVILINSSEKLDEYVSCAEGSYPEIDFSTHTLLLARGVEGYFVKPNSASLQQLSAQNYSMEVTLLSYETASVMTQWQMPVVISKIADEAVVELNVTMPPEEPDYPIEIPFEEYSLEGTSCGWTNFIYGTNIELDTVTVISEYAEQGNYITCEGDNYPEVDFSNYTLLLARVSTTFGIHEWSKHIQQVSDNKYILYVDVILDISAMSDQRIISIIVPKIPQHAIVELNEYHHHV